MDSATDLTTGHDQASHSHRSRFNATLVGEPLRQVEEIAWAEGVDLGEVVRRAIKLAHFIYRAQLAGAVIKRHAADGRIARITVNWRGSRARDD